MAVTFAFVAWTALSYAMMSVACDFFIAFLVCSMLSFLFLGFLAEKSKMKDNKQREEG